MSKLAKFIKLSSPDRVLVLETFILLGLSRAIVLTLPFRWLANALGRRTNKATEQNESLTMPQIHRVTWAIRRISCHTPWRSNCLAKAIAGRYMLSRRRVASTIYFGMVKNSEGELNAHAWLKSGNMILTGGSNLDRYAVVAKFTD